MMLQMKNENDQIVQKILKVIEEHEKYLRVFKDKKNRIDRKRKSSKTS